MTDAPVVCTTDRRGVATVTLNRPAVGNAFDGAMLAALAASFGRFATDDGVRCVVLRGAGRHFSSGADMRAAQAGEAPEPMAVLRAIDNLPKPTIALVHGACVGGGVAWAAACDIAIADETAFFSIPEVRLGMAAQPMLPLFVRALGARGLRRYALTGERFGADTALRLGLVHELCPAGGLDDAAAPVIDALLQGAPGAGAEIKRVIADCVAGEADTAALEAGFAAMRDGDEAREGRAAFLEKRKPVWYRD